MATGGAQRNPWTGCVLSHHLAPQGRRSVAAGGAQRNPWIRSAHSSSRPAGAGETSIPGTFTRLLYHVVFSTKHRANLIAPELQARLYDYLGGIVRGERGRKVTRRSR